MEDNLLSYHLLKVVSELETRMTHRIVTALSEQFQLSGGTPSVSERLMTDDDMCTYLNISLSTFYKFKKQHKDFPAIRFQSTVRYRKSDVDVFLSNLKIKKNG